MKQDDAIPPLPLTIAKRADALGQLFWFDSDIFRGDGTASQRLCDAMLSLALIFNDCRELLFRMEELFAQAPEAPTKLHRLFGEHAGAHLHSYRMLIGLFHEFGEVLQKHNQEFNGPFFRMEVLPQLHPGSRTMWTRSKKLATGKKSHKGMDKFLHDLRNMAAFHYDGEELRKGFERRFPSGSRDRAMVPGNPSRGARRRKSGGIVSLGQTVHTRRFYFADAAALDLIEEEATVRGLMPLGPKMTQVLADLSMGLAMVIEAFIRARRPRSPWRKFEEDS